MAQPELQRRIGPHAQADDMRVVDTKPVHDGSDVIDRTLPAVGDRILGNVPRRIAAGVVGDATISAREVANLVFPLPEIGSQLMYENDRITVAVLFNMQPCACGLDIWHCRFLCPHELISEKEQANDRDATARAPGSCN